MSFSSHTILIANLNPNESNYEECLSTLQYAERTKNASSSMLNKASAERQSSAFIGQDENSGGYGGFGGIDKKTLEKFKEEI